MASATAVSPSSLGLAIDPQSTSPTRADRKLQEMKSALNTLKTVLVSASSQQKSAAMAKLDALKQRLKMLRMMSGGDPKALASAAAQLAKEIAQAAKDYAAAGGSPADAGPPPPTSQAPPETQTPAAAGQSSEPVQASETPSGAPQGDGNADKAEPEAASVKATPPILQGPDPAMEEAKQLAAGARALLESAIARAKREHHAKPTDFKEERDIMSAADKDIADAARKVADADAPNSYGPTGLGLSAPATASGPVAAAKA